MNFLAHLFLAGDNTSARIGNLLGDFVKPPTCELYPPAIRAGILLHRKIDSFTDMHPLFARSRTRIDPSRRRYAGVIVDIFYDHFLAAHFSHYSAVSLTDFAKTVYASLNANRSILPESLTSMLPWMIRENWLVSYADIAGVHRTLNRMADRIPRADRLAGAAADLEDFYDDFATDFATFFPDVQTFVAKERTADMYL